MADKDTRVGQERLGRPVDELVTGRAPGAGDRPGDTTASELAGRATGTTPTPARRRAPGAAGKTAGQAENPDLRARELRAEIEQTREDMSETVNAIQDRLRPGTIASNAAESIRDTARERTRDVVESEPVQYARANPVPTAMIGIGIAGLAWLAFGGREPRDHRYRRQGVRRDWRNPGYRGAYGDADPYGGSPGYSSYERYDYGGYGSYGRDAGEGVTDRLADRASHVAEDVRERAEQASRRAGQQVRRAQSSLQRTWNESPLLLGAAAAVIGALVGAAVPETERENEWMGESRDQMLEGVQHAVQEKVEEVQDAATRAVDQVKGAVGLGDDTGNG